jgi:EmrB/QacA subfamily drug resistance transporter
MSTVPAAAPAAGFARRVPLIVAAAFFMETLDGTIVTTALPAIAQNMHRSALALTPSISAYLVAVAVFVPTAGWASDRFGSRRLFASAVALFTVASLLCAASVSPAMFFTARIIQGAAAAFMSPVGRLVVLRETPKQYLIEAISIITWPALIGPVVGPPLAGVITTYASWRWIFLINAPIGIAGVWLVLTQVPNHRDPEVPRFDRGGFLLTAVALAALIEGLTLASEPNGATLGTAGLLVTAGLVLAVLAIRHARVHPAPVLDLRATRLPTFSLSTTSAGMLGRIAISATPFLLPLMYEIAFGMSAVTAGLMLLIYMTGNLGMKSVTTPVLRRFGFRRVLAVNGLLCAATIAACGFLQPGTARLLMYALLLAAGMTRSMHFTSVNTLAFADISPSERAGASTLAAMVQQLAFTLGVTFAALMLALSEHARAAPSLGFTDFRVAFVGAGALMLAATLWTLRLPRGAGAEVAGRA